MSRVPFTTANLGSIIVQSFLYGAFLLLFTVCIYILHPTTRAANASNDGGPNRPKRSPNIILLVTSVILFLLITLGWVIHVVYVIRGFITHRDIPGTELYFMNPSEPTLVAQIALYVFQTLVADIIMIYRLYIVWNRQSWICIFPALCWLAATVSGILVVIAFSQQMSTNEAWIAAELIQKKLVIIAYSVTLALNAFCTGMISLRIWGVSRQVEHVGQSRLKFSQPIRIIVDSATIYTVFSLATLVAYLVEGRSAALSLMTCTGPVAGLSYCLIIVRVSLSRIQDRDTSSGPFQQLPSDGYPLSSASHTPNPIVVNVKRESDEV
jgi:hypothetical protein